MEKEERRALMKKLLEAKASRNSHVMNESFQMLIHDETVDWDLVTIILSSIPLLEKSDELFESFAKNLEKREDLPENAYTCIISNYSYFKNVEKALLWVERMQQQGFPVKNRHLFSLIQLAKETNNNELAERLHSFLDSTDLSINQKVRTEEILFHANQGDETSIIHSIRTIAKTDRYITDASIIQALQHFCETNPNWKLDTTYIRTNTCNRCNTPIKLNPISQSNRSTLYVYYVATSYQRKKQFESFKKEMEGISDIDVVVDGANVGFANANRKVNRDHLFLNATNIEMVIRELQKVQLNPFVILHHYHIKHLLKTNPSQVNILENLRQQHLLYYVREGSNDDWYWLYLALSHPHRYILSNDQMRDHLFHVEKEEMLFRQFREESQITYFIPPVMKKNTSIQFHFPKPYSICIQEGTSGFHLPFGHMEKSSFHLEKWYCLRKCSGVLSKVLKQM